MRYTCSLMLAVLFLPSFASAEFINQIPGPPFTSTLFAGNPAALSQFDTGTVTPPDIQNFATSYDNFTLTEAGFVTDVAWVGIYELPAAAHVGNFNVSIYTNGGAPSQPLAQLYSFDVGAASQTATGVGEFFSYSANLGGAALGPGDYWVSVVADLDFGDNGWGWAFSSMGDSASVQDFQNFETKVLERHFDGVDYAYSLTTVAVPEPTSGLLLGGAIGALSLMRRRRRA